jgi:preprotein translocase subunit SecD
MRTIIFSLVAMILFGMVATGLTKKPNNTHQIIIQAVDSNIAASSLARSVEIITGRLKSFGTDKFDVTAIGNNRIRIVLTNNRDLKTIEQLVTEKGVVGFYETWNYSSLKGLLHDDTLLFSLLHTKAPDGSHAEIGCTTFSEAKKVNDYLNGAGLDQKCKFVWSGLFENSAHCLYALKLENGKGVLLTGSDIERCTAKFDSSAKKDFIDLRFKKAAIGLWSAITKRNLNQSIVLLLDNKVVFAPMVRTEINGGNCEITGDFSQTEVRYIAAMGGNGELPVSFGLIR